MADSTRAHVPRHASARSQLAACRPRPVPRVAEVRLGGVVYVVHVVGRALACTGHEVVDRHLPYEQGLSVDARRARSRLLFMITIAFAIAINITTLILNRFLFLLTYGFAIG